MERTSEKNDITHLIKKLLDKQGVFFYLHHFLAPTYLLRIAAIFITLNLVTVNVLSSL